MRFLAILALLSLAACQQKGPVQGPVPPGDQAQVGVTDKKVVPAEAVETGHKKPPVNVEGGPPASDPEEVPESIVGPMSFPTDIPCQCELPKPPPPLAFPDPFFETATVPKPMVSLYEGVTGAQLGAGWTKATLEPWTPPENSSMVDAALHPVSLENLVQATIFWMRNSHIELLLANLAPTDMELLEFFTMFGIRPRPHMSKEFTAKLRAQALLLTPVIHEFGSLISRQDRLFGEIRMSLLTFSYKDAAGNAALGCFALIMVDGNWRHFDLTCELPEFIPAPEDIPGASVLDLSVLDQK